jgi:hypothetical protein
MSPERATHLQELSGPAEDTAEHAALAEQHGFSYRQLLGALMYAYVVCRLDIGYAVTLLSKYASAPHSEHYTAAKNVCQYLRRTKDWGLNYWQDKHFDSLPYVELTSPSGDKDL